MPSISARLDRLPITSQHRNAIAALAFAYFFELADLNTFGYAAPALVHAWHLDTGTIATIISASFGGMFVGAAGGGWVADRIGRKSAFIAAILTYTLFSLLNAASWDVFSLALFRFLTGIGLSAMTVIANTYVSEFFPARARGRYMATVVTIGLIGIPATAWVARFVVPVAPWGWRLVFVWGALCVFSLILAARMSESPRWLHNRGREADAEATTAALERLAVAEHGALAAPAAIADEAPVGRVAYAEMFRGQYRTRTIILLLVWIFQTLGFYGFVAWVPTLLVQHGFSVVRSLTYTSIIALLNPVGALIAAGLLERVERKWFITVDAIIIAVCGLLYGLTFDPVLIVIFGAGVVMGIQAMAAALYTYTPELYPTEVRSSAMGLCYGVGRLANVLGPFIVSGLYAASGYLSVFAYIAACWVGVAIVVGAFGPRTTGRPLELSGH